MNSVAGDGVRAYIRGGRWAALAHGSSPVNHVEIRSASFAPPSSIGWSWLVPGDRVNPDSAGPETESNAERDGSAEPARKVVLVVDDEQGMLDVMRFVLESEGFDVETARNGREALERLRTGFRPALLLLDMMMPVMSGWEFLDEVARWSSLKPPPIVVLTAGGSTEVLGAAEVLRKPYDLEVLIDAVERYTRG
jgi:CheY-like chemotaxis protein